MNPHSDIDFKNQTGLQMKRDRSMTIEHLRTIVDSELATWQAEVERQKQPGCTVLSGQPFIVYCEGGLALRLCGPASIPTPCTPGLCGISHFTAENARTVANLRGRPYRVVAADDVPRIRVHELLELRESLGSIATVHLRWLAEDEQAEMDGGEFPADCDRAQVEDAFLAELLPRALAHPTPPRNR